MILTVDNGRLQYQGETINPHRPSLAGVTAYYIDTDTEDALESCVTGRDKAYRSSPKADPSFTFVCDGGDGRFRAVHIGAWSEADNEADAVKDLLHFQNAIESEGWKMSDTASGLAGRICREHVKTRQLQPRWRELAHNSIHQGPMVCVRGGAPNAIAWDREKAFLRALYQPVPIGDWIAIHPKSFAAVKGMSGFVRATVRVEPSKYVGKIPPLPVRMHGYTLYPTGEMRGCWTLGMFFDALENGGYEIVEIHECIVSRALPLHAQAAERIEKIEDKQLRKILYTRYWGRLASTGGYEGYGNARHNRPKRLLGSKLFWYYMGVSPTAMAPPDYRPDHAAFIASDNHLVMNQAIRRYDCDRVIATHVDCLWTDDFTVSPFESFREKHRGDARFYGVGCYRVGSNLAAQGLKGQLNTQMLDEWGRKLDPGHNLYRQWHILGPNDCVTATSDPPIHDKAIASYEPQRNLPGDVYWDGWTSKGWIHKQKEEVSSDVLSSY